VTKEKSGKSQADIVPQAPRTPTVPPDSGDQQGITFAERHLARVKPRPAQTNQQIWPERVKKRS
jgi:hypothetical protein